MESGRFRDGTWLGARGGSTGRLCAETAGGGACTGSGFSSIAVGRRAIVGAARAHTAQLRSRGGGRTRPRARPQAVYGEARFSWTAVVFAGSASHALGIRRWSRPIQQPASSGPDPARADHARPSAVGLVSPEDARPRPARSGPAASGSETPGTSCAGAPAAGNASVRATPQGNTSPWPRSQEKACPRPTLRKGAFPRPLRPRCDPTALRISLETVGGRGHRGAARVGQVESVGPAIFFVFQWGGGVYARATATTVGVGPAGWRADAPEDIQRSRRCRIACFWPRLVS